MNYEIVKEWNDLEFGGSGAVGSLDMSRQDLVDKLGEPTQLNGNRLKERWLLRFKDGRIATIFRYNNDKENEWTIGGFGKTNKNKENLSLLAVQGLFIDG